MLLHASLIGPVTLLGVAAALMQPGSALAAYLTRYRLFGLSGVSRCRSTPWLLR